MGRWETLSPTTLVQANLPLSHYARKLLEGCQSLARVRFTVDLPRLAQAADSSSCTDSGKPKTESWSVL